MEVLLIVVLAVALAVAAGRWGVDSRDGFYDSRFQPPYLRAR